MEKDDLMHLVAETTGMPRPTLEQILDPVLDDIVQGLQAGGPIRLAGIGTFDLNQRRMRKLVYANNRLSVKMLLVNTPQFIPDSNLYVAVAELASAPSELTGREQIDIYRERDKPLPKPEPEPEPEPEKKAKPEKKEVLDEPQPAENMERDDPGPEPKPEPEKKEQKK